MAGNAVRVGFVGCGVHAREVLLPAVQRVGMDLAAVCDLDKRLAQRVTRRFGAFRAYQDVGRMIEEMDLDAVLVCGPAELHAEAAETALRAGCHLWTEMPAAPTADEAARIAELADGRGLIAQPGLMMRSAPAYGRLREIVEGEQFGAIRSVDVTWWPPGMHGYEDPMLFDLPHAMDMVRFFGGEVKRLAVARAGGECVLSITLEMASGAVGSVSFAAPAGCPRERVAVASMSAVATVDGRQAVTLDRCDSEESSVWGRRACAVGTEGGMERTRGYLPQIERFAAAVAGEEQPPAVMNDAVRALRLAEIVRASAGEMVDVG
jgi:myo-inositol 2-dehydrogenase/D-chiro-inositol 1-dehydrogenase